MKKIMYRVQYIVQNSFVVNLQNKEVVTKYYEELETAMYIAKIKDGIIVNTNTNKIITIA